MKKLIFAFLFLAGGNAWAADGLVVVSVKPLHSLVSMIMEGTGEPELLVSGSVSPHEYQMKPSDMQKLSRAKIVFYVGGGMESFLDNALSTLPPAVRKFSVLGIPDIDYFLYKARRGGAWEADEHEREAGNDPHILLDPSFGVPVLGKITIELSALHPENKEIYKANFHKYVLRIKNEGAEETKKNLSGLKGRRFIAFHDAYQYFEKEYGLKGVGSIVLEPGESPSPKRIREMRDKIKTAGVECVIGEPYMDDKLVSAVTEGTGARVVKLDPEAVAIPPGKELYFTMIKGIAGGFRDCLGGKTSR